VATVFRIDFSELSEAQFLTFVGKRIETRHPCYIVTPNLHFARLVHTNENFRAAIESAELRLCDSAILSAMLVVKGRRLPARLTGSDLTPKLLSLAEKNGWRVFLFGSDEATLEKVRKKYPAVICGVATPPFHDHPWELDDLNEQYLTQIRGSNPDILLVALGVRKQEYWARKYFVRSGVPVTMCIGASLDFIGNRIQRAPRLLSKVGLEWLWRLGVEPSRLWQRYSGDFAFVMRHGLTELLRRQ
jgi:N-acetylglucosaminyldiphosphoundecaprenol N-acetyl-beta-D-mannosaminyltransferase